MSYQGYFMYDSNLLCFFNTGLIDIYQAYDGHMNLIMSDVEETIMLVDADSVANGQGVVNVCTFIHITNRDV